MQYVKNLSSEKISENMKVVFVDGQQQGYNTCNKVSLSVKQPHLNPCMYGGTFNNYTSRGRDSSIKCQS